MIGAGDHRCGPESVRSVRFQHQDGFFAIDEGSLSPMAQAIFPSSLTPVEFDNAGSKEEAVCNYLRKINNNQELQCPTIFRDLNALPQIAFIRAEDKLSHLSVDLFGLSSGSDNAKKVQEAIEQNDQIELAISELQCDPSFQTAAKYRWRELKGKMVSYVQSNKSFSVVIHERGPDNFPRFILGSSFDQAFENLDIKHQAPMSLTTVSIRHPEAYAETVGRVVTLANKLFANLGDPQVFVSIATDKPQKPSNNSEPSGCQTAIPSSFDLGVLSLLSGLRRR